MRYLLFLFSMVLFLTGCESQPAVHLSDEFGNAVRANMALQTLNPEAGGPDHSATLDGQRVDSAVERLRDRSNQVESSSLLQGVGSN